MASRLNKQVAGNTASNKDSRLWQSTSKTKQMSDQFNQENSQKASSEYFLPSNPAEADKSEGGLAVPCGMAGPGGLPLPSGPHGRTGGTGGDVGPLKRISASTFSAL